jgi:mannose-1-phosphate guanylyltransferase
MQTNMTPQPVLAFVEKPTVEEAQQLIDRGALLNSFIMVARAKTLLQLFLDKHQSVPLRMQIALFRRHQDTAAIRNLYATLREVDFSRNILPGMESRLRVVRVPKCGWSDLGTPKRVIKVLQTTPRQQWEKTRHTPLNLALQHERQYTSNTAAAVAFS